MRGWRVVHGSLAAGAAALALALAVPAAHAAPGPSNPHVGYDRQSLRIDGRRVVLWSGEVHYARMPDPREWPAVLARMKAAGLNAISIYVPWLYHEPAPGISRWDGRYDLERFLRDARDAGLWVVVRHGPYVQGEMDGGGYPPWLLGRPGLLRTTEGEFTKAWKAWDADLLPRVARWEIGGPERGTVIALQIENEYPGDGAEPEAYMREQYAEARRQGITVPILHNDQQLLGTQPAPGRFGDIVDLYGFDNYPYGFTCCPEWGTSTFSQVDDFERRYRAKGAEDSPLYIPEVQGGVAPIAGDDGKSLEERYRRFVGYATVQSISLLGQGLTMVSQYMFFGGTSWGYTPFPNLGTSYDYAAPIREWTALGPRYDEQRRLGLQIAAAGESIAASTAVEGAVTADDADALYRVRRSDVDGALHVFLRNADSARDRAPRLTIGAVTTPPVPLPKQSARWLLANATLGGGAWKIAWSTAEVALAGPRTLVLFGDRGKEYAALVNGRRLDFTPGKARLFDMGGGKRVVVVDRFGAARTWVRRGRVVIGPALVFGRRIETDRRTSMISVDGARLRRTRLAGPPDAAAIRLPSLERWRFAAEAPEREPGYDDSSWRTADQQTTSNQVQPLTRPILFADAYEQPTGYVWYRGRFSGKAAGMCIEGRHRYHVWINGRSLKTVTSDAEVPGPNGLGGLGAFPPVAQDVRIDFPADAVREGENVIAVLTDDWGHTMDAAAFNQAKQPRGLISAALDRGAGAKCGFTLGGETVSFGQPGGTAPPLPGADGGIAWRLRGGRPGDYPNASGLHGEREGWYAPGFDDRAWAPVSLPDGGRLGAGEVGWYRTRFRVRLPRGVRAPIGLELDRAGAPAEIYLNGVHVARAGRDRLERFVLMPGLLRVNGRPNTLAIARWAVTGAKLPQPRLFAYPGAVTRVVRR